MATLQSFGQTAKPNTAAAAAKQNAALPTAASISTALKTAASHYSPSSATPSYVTANQYFNSNPTATPMYNPNNTAVSGWLTGTGPENNTGPLQGQSWEGGAGSTMYDVPSSAPKYVNDQAYTGRMNSLNAQLASLNPVNTGDAAFDAYTNSQIEANKIQLQNQIDQLVAQQKQSARYNEQQGNVASAYDNSAGASSPVSTMAPGGAKAPTGNPSVAGTGYNRLPFGNRTSAGGIAMNNAALHPESLVNSPGTTTAGKTPLPVPGGSNVASTTGTPDGTSSAYSGTSTAGAPDSTGGGDGTQVPPPNTNSDITGLAFQQLMSALPPEVAWMKPTLDYMASVAQGNKDLADSMYSSDSASITTQMDSLGKLFQKSSTRADDAYTDVKKYATDSLNKQLDLARSSQAVETRRVNDAKAQAQYDSNIAIRDAQIAQRKMVDKMTIGLALTGTAYDYAANANIAVAENDASQHIADMRQASVLQGSRFVTDQLAVDHNFTIAYTNAYGTYTNALTSATENHVTQLNALDQQTFTQGSALLTAQRTLNDKYTDNVIAAKKDLATTINESVKFAQQQHVVMIQAGIANKQRTLDAMKAVYTATGGLDGKAIGSAAAAMRESGWGEDIIGAFSSGKATVAGYNAYGTSLYIGDFTSGKYVDKKTGQDIGLMSVGLLGTNETQAKINSEKLSPALMKGYQTGDYSDFYKTAEQVSFGTMVGAERNRYAALAGTVSLSNTLLDDLDALKGKDQVIYDSIISRGLPYLNSSQDPLLVKLRADIGLTLAEYRKGISGTAVTDSEAKFLSGVISSADKDTIGSMMIKTKALVEAMNVGRVQLMNTRGFTAPLPKLSDPSIYNGSPPQQSSGSGEDSTDVKLQKIFFPSGGGTTAVEKPVGDYVSGLGRVTQKFDTQVSYTVEGGHNHNGIDIANREGTFVPSFKGGEIVAIEKGYNGGWGNTVKVRDNTEGSPTYGYTFRYSHLKMANPNLKKGDAITPEGFVGVMGTTGHSTGPHVHFEVYDSSGKPVDPESLSALMAKK